MMADRSRQMGLAETDTAVDEERVVLFARLIRHRLRCRVRELITRADHELRERIAWRQSRVQVTPHPMR